MFQTFQHRTVWPSVVGNPNKTIGLLALQGDVREHKEILTSLGAEVVEVRKPEHLTGLDGLIIPGGESTVIDKLSRMFGLTPVIQKLIAEGLPVYGTCAGMIMLADRIQGAISGQETFGGLDITIQRNALGSQIESFETEFLVPQVSSSPIRVAFIRAPIVVEVGAGVEVLARLDSGEIIAVQHGNLLGTSFHPEISGDDRFHRYFLNLI